VVPPPVDMKSRSPAIAPGGPSKSSVPGPAADPRWQRTRTRLLTVGFELLGEAGTEGVGVDAIIARAGISKQTFYNHFSDREAFAQELWLESRRVFGVAIARANAGVADPVQRVARGVATYARLAIDDPAHAHFIVRTKIRRSIIKNGNDGLERDLLEGAEQGRLQVDTVATTAMFVTGVTLMLMAQILDDTSPSSRASLCRENLTMLLQALGCSRDDGARFAADVVGQIIEPDLLD
jgi:AcrR family transcriptional regulator